MTAEKRVQQGIIRGPMLFKLYVSAMFIQANCKIVKFADDTILIIGKHNTRKQHYQNDYLL